MNQAYIMAVGLHREADRLATYVSWCLSRSALVTPIAMAKAGLYCTGKEDTTKCFSCGGRISHEDLTGPVMEIHKRQYPHCDFVNGKDTNNIPLGSVDKRTEESAKKISEYEEPNNKQTNGSGNNGKKKKKKKNKNKRITNDKEDYKRETSNEDDDDKENYSLIYDIENDPKYQEANRVLKSEYKRLLTFIYWPRNAPVMPEDLAKAGFYYAGTEDKVQCFCCSGVLKNWRQGDIPIDEHRYYFPSCDFVRGEDVGNEPMRPTTSKQSVINIGPSDRRRPRDHNKAEFIGRKHSENDTVVGAHAQSESSPGAQKPKHPNFVEEAARLGSYDSWKGCVSQEFLAKAGFFFTGIEDNVRCFHCDGALRNWEPTDEPWIEHARWFPKCQFLLKHRGSAFMKYVADKYPKPCAQNDPQKTDHRNGARSRKTFVAQQVNDFMRTDTAQVVLDMGYSKDMVKSVVRKHVKRNRECYKSTHDLLIAVWDLEKKLSAAGKSSLDDDDDDDDDDEDDNTSEKDEQLLGAVGGVSSITIDQYGSSSLESGLSSQKEMLDELEELKQKKTCKICMDSDVCMLFQPCGHLVTCDVCSSRLRQCPFCRTTIRSAVRAYMA